MKKITKAAIAGGLGVVLLAGGAGSLAFWTAEADGPEALIQSGELSFGEIGDGTWTVRQNAEGVEPAQPGPAAPFLPGDKIVPGDVLTNTVSVPVILEGKNIKAQFVVDGAVAAVGAGADVELEGALIVVDPGQSVLTESGLVDVTITVTFPWETENAMDGAVNFTSKYTLTQIPVATP